MQRTLTIETLEKSGEVVTIKGWVNTLRDHGKVAFIDLRDRAGLIQVVFTSDILKQVQTDVSVEDVVEITGMVQNRPENLVNPDMATGTVELEARSLNILNETKTLPFPIDTAGRDINEDIRLKYRYVDLKRERLTKT